MFGGFWDEGTFGPTTVMLFRGSRTNPLTWDIIWIYPSTLFFEIVTEHNYIRTFGILLIERHTEITEHNYIRTFGILLIERHTEIEHVLKTDI